eukprot:54886_1
MSPIEILVERDLIRLLLALQVHPDLLFDPFLAIRLVGRELFIVYETTEVGYLVQKLEQVCSVVRDVGLVRVFLLQAGFVHLAKAIHRQCNGFKICEGSRELGLCRLEEDDGMPTGPLTGHGYEGTGEGGRRGKML